METSFPDTRFSVYPFAQRIEGDEAIIANQTKSSYLAVPASALDILTDLAAGRTVGQAQSAFAEKHGETPDMEDFLALLEGEGFIVRTASARIGSPHVAEINPVERPADIPRYHFEGISQQSARRLFSRPVLGGSALITTLALLAITNEPSILPSPAVMVFKHDLTPLTLAMTTFIFVTIFFHEMAHLVAARAAGVPARLGLSNRLWYLVAETDMTGVWLASRRERYLAFLAGPLVDATSGAVLVLILWTNRQWPWLPQLAVTLGEIFLFTYGVRLAWQCFFFVRTDFYYVIATYFNCKNLLGDTENWLSNQIARLQSTRSVIDQSAIPIGEQRVIRCYAVVWLVGRGLAFGTLIWVSLPILRGYVLVLIDRFFGTGQSTYSLVDALVWSGLALAVQGTGIFFWLRGIYRSRSIARRMIA